MGAKKKKNNKVARVTEVAIVSVTWSLGLTLRLFVFMCNVIRITLLKITGRANYKLRQQNQI